MRRFIAAMVSLAFAVGLTACNPVKKPNDTEARAATKCSETVRTNCISGNVRMGKGGVRKTLFQGRVIMPEGLSGEQSDPYPNSKAWEDRDKKRVVKYYASWWDSRTDFGQLSKYEMNVKISLDFDENLRRVNGKDFQEAKAGAKRGSLAKIVVTPTDIRKPFQGSLFCGIYIWAPKNWSRGNGPRPPHVTWGWNLPEEQPGGYDAAKHITVKAGEPAVCSAILFVP